MSDSELSGDSSTHEPSSPLQDASLASSTIGTRAVASTSSVAPLQGEDLLNWTLETEFSKLGTLGIPKFAGECGDVFDAFITQVEAAWEPYRRFRMLWKYKIVNVYLEGRAKKLAWANKTYDFELFKQHMEKKFPSRPARHYLRLRMCEGDYLHHMDLKSAITRAKRDYNSVGADFDCIVPACRLVSRIPHPVLRAYALKPHKVESGRRLLREIERIVRKETANLGHTPDWAKAREAARDNENEGSDADNTAHATTNLHTH
ncbi:hypothetical protein GQ54DRAFT_306611 [Martensiomyces pterosporus]|nr:hypothetical protein GQ54DRAFT_306611 [Martensiomyces pterosporus]